MTAVSPSQSSKILVKAGETGQSTQLALKSTGVIEVTASNNQLAEGGTIINVRASGSPATPSPSVTITPSTTPASTVSSTTDQEARRPAREERLRRWLAGHSP